MPPKTKSTGPDSTEEPSLCLPLSLSSSFRQLSPGGLGVLSRDAGRGAEGLRGIKRRLASERASERESTRSRQQLLLEAPSEAVGDRQPSRRIGRTEWQRPPSQPKTSQLQLLDRTARPPPRQHIHVSTTNNFPPRGAYRGNGISCNEAVTQ